MNFGFNYEAAADAAEQQGEYDGDAEPDQDNFMFFETPSGNSGTHRRFNKKRRKQKGYEPYGDDELDENGEKKKARVKPVYDFVDMETMRRKCRIKAIKNRVAPMPPPPPPASTSESGGGGGGGFDNHLANAEIAAAAAAETDMWESSCSEDEEVLTYELNHYGVVLNEHGDRHPHRHNATNRSEDLPSSARLFEESNTQTGLGGADGGAAGSADEYSHYAEEAREEPQSKRSRVRAMREHLRSEKRRRGVVAESCFKCMYGNERYDGVYAKPMAELFKLMEQEIGRRDLRAVARTVHLYFKHAIYLPMLKAGRYVPMWRTRSIYEHLTEHETEPRVQLYRQIKSLNQMQAILLDEIHLKDKETGEIKVNVPVARLFLDTVKTSNQLQMTDPKKMLFYNDKAAIDLGAAGANANNTNKKSTVRGRFVLKPLPPPS